MGVSENRGTPKSSILIGFSIINHPIWGTPIFGNTHMAIKVSLCQNANPHMWSKGKKRVKKSSLKGKSAKRDLFFSNWWWVVHLHCASFVSDSKRISLNQSQSKALNWFELHALFLWYAIPTRINSYLKYLSLVHQPRPFFFRDKSTRKNHPRWTQWGRRFGFRIQTAEGQSIETNQATCEWKGPNLRSFANAIYECFVFCSGGFKWELYSYNKVAHFVWVVGVYLVVINYLNFDSHKEACSGASLV